MEERNICMFRNDAETRVLEFGRLHTGEAYVRETSRGDIAQFCYDAPAREVTVSFSKTEEYSLEDVADTFHRNADDVYIGDIANALTLWEVPYEKDEKSVAVANCAAAAFLGEKDVGLPHYPTRRGRRGSAPPSRPLRAFRRAGLRAHGSPTGGGDSSAGMASCAGLRQPPSACGRSRARLRQTLRACLRHRAQPARSVTPGLSRFPRVARYAPRHSRPSAPRPPLPRRRCGRSRARLARGVVG